MDQILASLQIGQLSANTLPDDRLIEAYWAHLARRVQFLLGRFDKHPDFPGVHTGYNAITGEQFADEHIVCYGWINGRGACSLSRFALSFPADRVKLQQCAARAAAWIEQYVGDGRGRVPFTASIDGVAKVMPSPERTDCRTYSDLHACAGLLEYGVAFHDSARVAVARRMLDESVAALNENRFLDEPDPGQEGGVAENPWSWALDLTNEFAKQLQEPAYLDVGARLLQRLLDHYYLPDVGALVEYATPEGLPLADDQGRYVVDPGHSIEFASFALEFSRLAELAGAHEALRADANRLCPPLILWNLARGWNPAHPGIFKSFDLNTGQPINRTMPWWSLPETMLALLLAFERTRDVQLLSKYKDVNNAYFGRYLNPKTGYGPYQTLDGDTGQPLDLPPACKFQDPEFHSGKNILTCIQVLERTGRQQ